MEAPRKWPLIKVPLMSENLADTVDLSQWAYPAVLEYVDPTPSSFSHAASRVSRSSRSMPPVVALAPLAQIPKLEVQMATLLLHIKLWIDKSIAEIDDRIENPVPKKMEKQIMGVHKRLYAFALCF